MVGGGIEGVGDALTGGVIARQFEPGAGEAHDGDHGGACLNCGAELTGPYCHRCGQPAHIHRSLAAFWHDLAHGVLHFEGKIWRTLPLLAWRPGDLTRRYIEGERARFVSPMALFLFSVFLMFAMFNFVGGPFTAGEWNADGITTTPLTIEQKIDRVQGERAKAVAAGQGIASLNLTIQALHDQAARQAARKASGTAAGVESDDGQSWFERAYHHAKENPQLLAYKVQTNAYKFSWMLIPISVPFVWLLFLHRRRYRAFRAYDHTVFVTYSLAFMTLLLVVLSLLHAAFVPAALAGLAFILIPPVHICRQLHGAYALSWFSALWRTLVLVVFAGFDLLLFLLLLVALGVMH